VPPDSLPQFLAGSPAEGDDQQFIQRRNTFGDYASSALVTVGVAMPAFILGPALIILFSFSRVTGNRDRRALHGRTSLLTL